MNNLKMTLWLLWVLMFFGGVAIVGCEAGRKDCDGVPCAVTPDHFHEPLQVADSSSRAVNEAQQRAINRLEKFYINSVIGSPEEFCGECTPKSWEPCTIQNNGGVTCECVCGEVEEDVAPVTLEVWSSNTTWTTIDGESVGCE
jgi:hypothetical protein